MPKPLGQGQGLPRTIQEELDSGHNVALYPESYALAAPLVLKADQWIVGLQAEGPTEFPVEMPNRPLSIIPAWRQRGDDVERGSFRWSFSGRLEP